MSDVVVRDRRGRVEVITINRPDARNAINPEVAMALEAAFDETDADDGVWALVVTGAGEKAFSAGMDLKAFASGGAAGLVTRKGGFAGMVTRGFNKPVIAAVNGHALAGGFEIALACDLVVAAEHATFGLPEVKRGIMAGAGGPIRLSRRVPQSLALELVMTGEAIDAQRALSLGLVNRVVPADRVVDEAVALAEQINGNAPVPVRLSRRLVREALYLSEEDAWKRSNEYMGQVLQTEDVIEGPRAFAEKRKPEWKGR